MARTKQTARKLREPNPPDKDTPDKKKIKKGDSKKQGSKSPRKLSHFWSPFLVQRSQHQHVNLTELQHFDTEDYVNVVMKEDDAMQAYNVYFDKLHNGLFYGYVNDGKVKHYVHFHLDCVHGLVRKQCA